MTTPLSSRLLVQESEYHVVPSHDPVAAGTLQFTIANEGMDQHDMAIVGPGGQIIAQTDTLNPGATATLSVDLPAGNYTLECTLYNHAALGMKTTLIVR